MKNKNFIIVLTAAISIALTFVIFFMLKTPDIGSVICANVGKDFSVILDSNPTTGYSWQLAEPLDENLLKLIKSNFIPPDTDLVGAPGQEEWAFQALRKGKTTISFHYLRPWEKDVPPVQIKSFIVISK